MGELVAAVNLIPHLKVAVPIAQDRGPGSEWRKARWAWGDYLSPQIARIAVSKGGRGKLGSNRVALMGEPSGSAIAAARFPHGFSGGSFTPENSRQFARLQWQESGCVHPSLLGKLPCDIGPLATARVDIFAPVFVDARGTPGPAAQ